MVKVPIASSVAISTSMKSNKSKDTRPEKAVRKILRQIGFCGYRLNWKKAPGKPDIAFPGRKIAIFVNGCFWHRCPHCNLAMPKTHVDYWSNKFENNIRRDEMNYRKLESIGWNVIIIWECEIKNNEQRVVTLLKRVVGDVDNKKK